MKARLTFGVLVANLVVGLFLLFAAAPKVPTHYAPDTQESLQTVPGKISGSFLNPENTSFEFEWNPQIYFSSASKNSLLGFSSFTKPLSSSYSSLPLFDCKKLFIHFFHTW